MAEMAQQCAAVLPKLLPVDLTVRVICLLKIHRDHAMQVSGRHGRIQDGAHDLECQSKAGLVFFGRQCNAQLQQRIDQPALRDLHLAP